ncbi:unnamed protein product [Symbiodinium sp. CCMP2592]|nr:unnamed protein product [Symbiodinium sp. CCMP2592]
MLRGELGRQQLLIAARAQPRCRATPEGSLPAELWSLIMQTGPLAVDQPAWIATEAVRFFEAVQTLGYNPQAWCDGFGCAIPKTGGSPGPSGQRIINLLDPGGKMFYKALWNATPDQPAAHQYGYAAGRSRRDAILHVEAWLDRLRFNKLHTAAILFDLTKAFDTLSLPSTEQAVRDTHLQPAAEQLLLDLYTADFEFGGGTGPRIFRIAYDSCVLEWEQASAADESEFLVDYAGQQLFLGVAAYADDLIRIVIGRNLQQLATTASQNLASLEGVLQPRNLQLNERKGETLLSFSGKGAYKAARDAHAGHWPCYPPKLVVKYLGAQIHATGSLSAEIRKRVASAKAGFARFARFFKRSQVPLPRKVLVFKAVVNEALLSALEVRPLSRVDERALESARGLLLRRLFGRQGYGAVAGDPQNRSVTIDSLRRRANLATVASELRVRRLLWLRKALLYELDGQTRLELAALFGVSNKLHNTLMPGTGAPSQHAPRFLHLLFRDLQSVLVGFSGFSGNWKTCFLQVSVAALRRLRTVSSPQAANDAADVVVPQVEANASTDDEAAVAPAVVAPPVPVFSCQLCDCGPWRTARALQGHMVSKHRFRHALQDTKPELQHSAPQLHRLSTSAPLLSSSRYEMPSMDFLQPPAVTSPTTRAPKRTRSDGPRAAGMNPLEQQVKELSLKLDKVCQLVVSHDHSIREMEAWSTRTWIFEKESELSTVLMSHMNQWKQHLPPQGQPHPHGPARLTVGAGLAKWLLEDPDRRQAMPKFTTMHDAMTGLTDMHNSIQLAYVKVIKDGRTLLKLRPQQSASDEWTEAFTWMQQSLASLKAESKDAAPPGPLVRSLTRRDKPAEAAE